MFKKIAGIILAMGFAHIAFADVTHDVYFSYSNLSFRQEKGYDIVELKGCDPMDMVGEPMLPVRYMNLIIPAGNKVSRIEFPLANSQSIGTYNIYPAQPPIPVSSTEPPEWVEPDSIVYSSDEPYPGKLAEVVHEGYFNGNKIVMVAVYPLQWTARTGELVLYDHIQLKLILESSSETPVYPQIMTEQSYRLYESALYSLVENDVDIGSYKYEPTIVNPQSTIGEFILPTSCTDTIEYMIITPDSLASSFNSFVEWLWKKGIRAGIITVEDILASYPGVDDAQKVKRCIWNWWQFNSLSYVLLAGDDNIVPHRYACAKNNPDTTARDPADPWNDKHWIIPCDLYFSDLTYAHLSGDWNSDGDQWYGEPQDTLKDVYPEVYVGRITVRTSQEVANWIEECMVYERNPGNDTLMTHKVYIVDSQFLSASQNIVDPGYPSYFTRYWLIDETPSNALNSLNVGYGQYNIHCHGCRKDFATKKWAAIWSYPHPDQVSLDELTNENRYPFVYSVSCKNAAFDWEVDPDPSCGDAGCPYRDPQICVADGFTDAYSKRGAAVYLGNTRYGWYSSSWWLERKFVDLMFGDGPKNVGYLEGMSKTQHSSIYLRYGHNLFGSPETPIWTDVPPSLTASHPSRIYVDPEVGVLLTITVTSNGSPVEDALVCLYKSSDDPVIHKRGYTDTNGKVTFSLRIRNTGYLYVTATKHNFKPYEGSILCTYPPCPFLYTYNGSEFIEDNNILAGSGNGEEVTDWYKLMEKPVKDGNRYRLQLREESSEHSFLDRVRLVAIDHPDSVEIFVAPDAGIIPVSSMISSQSVTGENGEDYTDDLLYFDNIYVEANEVEKITADFGEANGGDYVLLAPSKPKPRLMVEKENESGFEPVGFIRGRENPSYEVLPLTVSYPEDVNLRLTFTDVSQRIDFMRFGKRNNAPYHVKPCPLAAATHSEIGSVKQRLLVDDENYAELLPGDTITLEFEVIGIQPGWIRDFVFVSNGYYIMEGDGGTQTATSNIPLIHSLSLYPNPVKNNAIIRFGLPKEEKVSLKVYDVSGREVKTLTDGRLKAGYYTIRLDNMNFPSGIYFARLVTDSYEETKKLVLMK
ncbi:T9SS type A sorting domain-containing protein [candidate division WOR-3 bacterium]|nr:T9SS type A sorting domain-containing protein [candidate division WOR-3 bacterium]